MQHAKAMAFALTLGSLMCGCTGSEETQEPVPPALPPPVKEEPPHMVFETKIDTVDVTQTGKADSSSITGREPQIRFMVQIGAFKNPRLAVAVQTRARTRYRMPVLNDYDLRTGLYQIRIGFFETRQAAIEFREKMLKQYPNDYSDSWVVQLRR